MQIYLNGGAREVPAALTVAGLLESLGLVGRRLAVEVNLEIVPRSVYADTVLQPGDRVEVVHAIGGG